MQTIFVGTDRTGKVYPYTEKPEWDAKNGDFSGHWRFQNCEPSFAPPPGECREYRLVPAGEADAKDAHVAELEKQLAERDNQLMLARGDCEVYRKQLSERSPGVMPECVTTLLIKMDTFLTNPAWEPEKKDIRDYYTPPTCYEWQPVTEDAPITAADVGRKVWRYGEVLLGDGSRNSTWVRIEKVYVLRPVAAKFKFTGEPGRYRTDSSEEVDVINAGFAGLVVLLSSGEWKCVATDGTFSGGRITGRVNE